MFWQITSYPRCTHHIFLSHCAVDRNWLVHPVFNELEKRGIIPWLDRDDYPYGHDSRTALRDGLLRSRHIVYFITLGMMDYRRGWCPMELAYSDVVQRNLAAPGGTLLNYELSLFFLDRADTEIQRTILGALWDNGIFSPSDGDPVAWAVDQIDQFLHREQELAVNMLDEIVLGNPVHQELSKRRGLVERVTLFDPSPIA